MPNVLRSLQTISLHLEEFFLIFEFIMMLYGLPVLTLT